MAGNARGKLKEELEGILRNFSWIKVHCEKAKGIIGETHPELHTFFDQIDAQVDSLGGITAGVLQSV